MTKDERQIEAAKAAITEKRSALPSDHPLEMAIREMDYRKNNRMFSRLMDVLSNIENAFKK